MNKKQLRRELREAIRTIRDQQTTIEAITDTASMAIKDAIEMTTKMIRGGEGSLSPPIGIVGGADFVTPDTSTRELSRLRKELNDANAQVEAIYERLNEIMGNDMETYLSTSDVLEWLEGYVVVARHQDDELLGQLRCDVKTANDQVEGVRRRLNVIIPEVMMDEEEFTVSDALEWLEDHVAVGYKNTYALADQIVENKQLEGLLRRFVDLHPGGYKRWLPSPTTTMMCKFCGCEWSAGDKELHEQNCPVFQVRLMLDMQVYPEVDDNDGDDGKYQTIDGKWWLFDEGGPVRLLTDDEAACVIWGVGQAP